jgi:tRNA (cmo5U34)-methyltransferase
VTADFAAAAPSKSYDAVVSALAIYHLPDSGKRHLFADIFKYLTPGGVFINADQIAGETPAIDRRSRQALITPCFQTGWYRTTPSIMPARR